MMLFENSKNTTFLMTCNRENSLDNLGDFYPNLNPTDINGFSKSLLHASKNHFKRRHNAKNRLLHFLRKYKKPTITEMPATTTGTAQYCFVRAMSF